MELHYVTLIVTFTLKKDLADPYALFTCRSAFEDAFRLAAGCRRGECRGCGGGRNCAYAATFGQELSRDPDAVRRHQKPPLPFVFGMPVLPPAPNRGATVACSLSVFGSATQQLDCYRAAVGTLLAHFGAEVAKMEVVSQGGGRSPLPAGCAAAAAPLPLLSAADAAAMAPLSPDRLTVELVTPLKLIHDGKPLKTFSFPHFARALMRRTSAVCYYYGGFELPLDYRTLSAASESVRTVRCDCRFEKWGTVSGVVGEAEFAGNLDDFHHLLLWGSALHLGKGASFGQGEFRLG